MENAKNPILHMVESLLRDTNLGRNCPLESNNEKAFTKDCLDCEKSDTCEIVKAHDEWCERMKQEDYLKKHPWLNLDTRYRNTLIKQRFGHFVSSNLDHNKMLARKVKGVNLEENGIRILSDNRKGKTFALASIAWHWCNTAWHYVTAYDLVETLSIKRFEGYTELTIEEKVKLNIPQKREDEKGKRLVLLDDVNVLTVDEAKILSRYIDYIQRCGNIILCVASNLDRNKINQVTKDSNELKRLWLRIYELTEPLEKE